jgi:hypothetical protein
MNNLLIFFHRRVFLILDAISEIQLPRCMLLRFINPLSIDFFKIDDGWFTNLWLDNRILDR